MTRNQLQYWQQQEQQRSNYANEQETRRSNLAKEQETYRNNIANLDELRRSNMAREEYNARIAAETERHQRAMEQLQQQSQAETARSNLAHEGIKQGALNVSYAQLDETIAHNRANEQTNLMSAIAAQKQAQTSAYAAQTSRIQTTQNVKESQNKIINANAATYNELMRRGDAVIAANLDRKSRERIAEANRTVQSQGNIINLITNLAKAAVPMLARRR